MLFNFLIALITLVISILHCSALPSSKYRAYIDRQSQEENPILIIVSYDGFRNEYLERNVTPNMLRFRNEGVYADHMVNVFPTKTFTNHHSIATGFYPNVHGVLANSLYDTVKGPLSYSYELFHYNDSILPIWIVNERAGGRSGCMMWPGTNFKYADTECTFTQDYSPSIPLMDRVDTVIKWLTDPVKPVNLVMLYSEQPDKLAHVVGPDSDKITEIVGSLDLVTKYIQEQLVLHKLENRTNVIHLSDHGMAGVTTSKFINLTDFLEDGTYTMYGTSPVLQIVPIEGKLEDVYERLRNASYSNRNFKVYKSENLPVRWHATNKRRFGPIIAVANMNYGFQDLWVYTNNTENSTEFGAHGYDNDEELMYPIFMAKGPALKTGGKQVKPFETVDLFTLYTNILQIEDNTVRNGSAMRIMDVLADKHKTNDTTTIIIVLVSVGAILAVLVYIVKFHNKKHAYIPT